MGIKIVDPALGKYSIKQDYQGIAVCEGEKSLLKCGSLEQAYKDISHRLLMDENKDMSLLEYNKRALEIANNIINSQKPKEEE